MHLAVEIAVPEASCPALSVRLIDVKLSVTPLRCSQNLVRNFQTRVFLSLFFKRLCIKHETYFHQVLLQY